MMEVPLAADMLVLCLRQLVFTAVEISVLAVSPWQNSAFMTVNKPADIMCLSITNPRNLHT